MLAIAILDLITILTIGLIVGIAPYIKKVTNNYFFWIILGAGLLTYILCCRFINQWQCFWSDVVPTIKDKTFDPSRIGDSLDASRGLLLDICPFTCVVIMFAIIVDPTRKIAKAIAPFGIFNCLITILGGIGQDDPQLTASYIFLGNSENPMYFMMHYLMLLVGTLVLVSAPRVSLKDWIFSNLYAGVYYLYVAICMTSLHLQYYVSGLNIGDWSPEGEYYGVAQFLNMSPQASAGIGFTFCYLIITLIIYGQNRLQWFKRYRWYDVWNKKQWYIGWYSFDSKNHHSLYKTSLNLNNWKQNKKLYLMFFFVVLIMVGLIFTTVGLGFLCNHGSLSTSLPLFIIGIVLLMTSTTWTIILINICKKEKLIDLNKKSIYNLWKLSQMIHQWRNHH